MCLAPGPLAGLDSREFTHPGHTAGGTQRGLVSIRGTLVAEPKALHLLPALYLGVDSPSGTTPYADGSKTSIVMTQHAQVWVLIFKERKVSLDPRSTFFYNSSWQKFPPDIKDIFYALVHSSDRFA